MRRFAGVKPSNARPGGRSRNPERAQRVEGPLEKRGSRTCKPNSVCCMTSRTVIPLGWALLPGSSDLPGGLAHRAGTHPAGSVSLLLLIQTHRTSGNFLPIWSCSVWGLPCPRHYCRGGALLPHLFTLTPPVPKDPMHSYDRSLPNRRGGMFSVALSVG